ncbi:MAG: ferritin-like domain-containing protein [Steroidobacteraceae bacterium]
MTEAVASPRLADREAVLHALYEAAELEHNLMCTYLYAAFSLRSGADDGLAHDSDDGLAPDEAAAVGRWRQALFDVAIEEMSHLAAVWNITSALGGSPRVGRTNFPIDPGLLPASVVVRLAPFNAHTLQHFIYLERPAGSDETWSGPPAPTSATAKLSPSSVRTCAAAKSRGSRRWASTTTPSATSIRRCRLVCARWSIAAARAKFSAAIRRCRSRSPTSA